MQVKEMHKGEKMRPFGYIQKMGNKYRLYIKNQYKGSFDTREEADIARESYRETYDPVEISIFLPLFAERLNEAIGQRSVISVCRQARIARSNIDRYLNGDTPSVKNLISLALALNVSTDWLLGIESK